MTRFVAAGFGSGFSPVAPGTSGTLAALPLAYLLSLLDKPVSAAVLALFTALSVYVCGAAAAAEKDKDPAWIVMDEFAGLLVATLWVEPSLYSYGAAFFLFRLFDIMKPPPVNMIDRSDRGGFSIVFDDVAAGLMARALMAWPLGF